VADDALDVQPHISGSSTAAPGGGRLGSRGRAHGSVAGRLGVRIARHGSVRADAASADHGRSLLLRRGRDEVEVFEAPYNRAQRRPASQGATGYVTSTRPRAARRLDADAAASSRCWPICARKADRLRGAGAALTDGTGPTWSRSRPTAPTASPAPSSTRFAAWRVRSRGGRDPGAAPHRRQPAERVRGPQRRRAHLAGRVVRGEPRASAASSGSRPAGFTSMSGRVDPGQMIAVLNRVFDCQVPAVDQHGGEILKFMGDGMLAIFPIDPDRGPARAGVRRGAGRCARCVRRARCAQRRARGPAGGEALSLGVALHLGDVAYGNIGDAVGRLASRAVEPRRLASRMLP